MTCDYFVSNGISVLSVITAHVKTSENLNKFFIQKRGIKGEILG